MQDSRVTKPSEAPTSALAVYLDEPEAAHRFAVPFVPGVYAASLVVVIAPIRSSDVWVVVTGPTLAVALWPAAGGEWSRGIAAPPAASIPPARRSKLSPSPL